MLHDVGNGHLVAMNQASVKSMNSLQMRELSVNIGGALIAVPQVEALRRSPIAKAQMAGY